MEKLNFNLWQILKHSNLPLLDVPESASLIIPKYSEDGDGELLLLLVLLLVELYADGDKIF